MLIALTSALAASVAGCAGAVKVVGIAGAAYVGSRLLPINTHAFVTPKTESRYVARYASPIVEFDDDGFMRDDRQIGHALEVLRDSAARHRVLALVYVHGWDHTARFNDSDLDSLNALAAELTARLNAQPDGEPTWDVVPVYMAWRGKSWLGDPKWYNLWAPPVIWKATTFWDRKATGERIGRSGLAAAMSQISSQWRAWRLGADSIARENMLIVVGHSFGGGAVLSAMLPGVMNGLHTEAAARVGLLANTLSQEQRAQATAPGLADLVIAVNPAIEAAVLDNTVLDPSMGFDRDHAGVTRLLLLDAENDFPRRYLFPVGRTISQALSFHHFHAERVAAGREPSQIGFRLFSPDSSARTCASYPTSDPRFKSGLVGYEPYNAWPGLGCKNNSVMIMRATDDDKVIDNHGGFWEPAVTDFVRQFVANEMVEGSKARARLRAR